MKTLTLLLPLTLIATACAAPVGEEHKDVGLDKRQWGYGPLGWGVGHGWGYGRPWGWGWKRDLEGHPDEHFAKRDAVPIEERDAHDNELDKRQYGYGGYGGGYRGGYGGGYGYRGGYYGGGYYGGGYRGGYRGGYGGYYKRNLDDSHPDLSKRDIIPLEERAIEPVNAATQPVNAATPPAEAAVQPAGAAVEPVDAAVQPAEAYPYWGRRPWGWGYGRGYGWGYGW
ncbi:hypothetical protein JCM3770_007366 [Rhodotorula araucariae]